MAANNKAAEGMQVEGIRKDGGQREGGWGIERIRWTASRVAPRPGSDVSYMTHIQVHLLVRLGSSL